MCDDSISSRYSLENFLADNLLADKHLSMASAFQPKEYKETVPCNPSLKASNGKGPELVSTRSAKTENESALAEPAQSGSHHGCIRDGVLEKSEGSNTKGGVSACDDGSLSASSAVFLDHQSAKKVWQPTSLHACLNSLSESPMLKDVTDIACFMLIKPCTISSQG